MLILQLIAGGFYLLNKVFLSLAERARRSGNEDNARSWRIASWVVYLIGLPPWVILFGIWHNWIAMSVEASAAPAMVVGLISALHGTDKKVPSWLDRLAIICVPLGFAYSLHDFGGLTKLTQWLEIGTVIGFLVGTYQLAKERTNRYLWFVLMHLSCGALFWVQHSPWLVLHQTVSLAFIVDAHLTQRRTKS